MGTIVSNNHIELVDNGFGRLKPVIAGKRITVHEIASMVAIGGSPVEWVVENFDLTPAEIHAALSYYYDHQEQIDREIREADEYVEQHAIDAREHLAKLRARLAAKDKPPTK
ncbi:MAG: hypothetical protein BroJett018_29330 [Chloroflexota bacterium]|nr:MAG: hypothetical protein BroJett018_29330 [Chloroflexota bacterium]